MSEPDRGSLRLAALLCPACGNDLDGLAPDRVFGCGTCARAWSVEPDGLRDSPLVCWEAGTAGPVVDLPVWAFEVEATVVLPPKTRVSLPGGAPPAERLVPFPHPRVYVAAFELVGRTRFGDPGLHLTRRQPAARVREGGPPPRLAGATLTRAVAAELVPGTVLSVVDVIEDVLGGKVDLRIVSHSLVLVPFARREDGGVTEPFGGVGYPPAAIPDLGAIAAAAR